MHICGISERVQTGRDALNASSMTCLLLLLSVYLIFTNFAVKGHFAFVSSDLYALMCRRRGGGGINS